MAGEGAHAPDELVTYTATSTSTEVFGRTLNTARHNHFVIDSPSGPAEAVWTGEAFLAGISACGVTLVQGAARDAGIPLDRLEVRIDGSRLKSAPADFHHIDLVFAYSGPTLDQAEELTKIWKDR